MRPSELILFCLGIASALQFCFCSLPEDVKPVRWKMNIELPVTDQRFLARDLLPKNAIPNLEVRLNRDSAAADTATIVKKDSIKYAIQKQLVATDTSVTEKMLGARALEKTPFVDASFSLMRTFDPSLTTIQLPGPLLLVQSQDKPLAGIQSVSVDESSPPLVVHVANRAKQADMNNVQVTILDKGDTVGILHSDFIPAQSAITKQLPLSGETIHDPITVAVHAEIAAGSTVNQGDGLNVSFSLDGQVVREAVVIDSMIDYADVFDGDFNIADSINLSVIDLDDAILLCEVTNPSGLKVGMKGRIDNAWKQEFAMSHHIETIGDLTNITDSTGFAGDLIDDTISKSATVSLQTFTISLKNLRLFPFWDTDSGRSTLTYRYTVKSLSDGRFIQFNKNDKFVFKLIPSRFPFIRIKGTFIEPTVQHFSSRQGVSFGWKHSIIDSLQKSFRFQSARIRLDLLTDFPENSSIDSLLIHFVLKDDAGGDSVVVNQKLTAILPGSRHSISADIASILNTWPDSIAINAELRLPSGTMLDIYNEKTPAGDYKSSLSIGVAVNYTIELPLAWNILDTITTELDQSSISPGLEDFEWIRKITDPFVSLDLEAFNNTNLNFTLFAIGAANSYKNELSAFPDSLIGNGGIERGLGRNLFNLFGERGILLGARGKKSTASVQIDQRGIDAFLSEEKCLIRWFLVIPASSADAFKSSDYLDLKATASIRGTANSDSLLYEDK